MNDHRLSDFVWNCRRIIEDKGSAEYRQEIGVAAIGWGLNPNNAIAFKDDVVSIVCEAAPSPAMLVVKLANSNPVLCINRNGDPYRQHGEFTHIEAHVAMLCRFALAKRLSRMNSYAGGHGIVSMDHMLAIKEVVDAAEVSVQEVGNVRLERALDILNDTPLVE